MSPVIQIQELSKCYTVTHAVNGYTTLRESLTSLAKAAVMRRREPAQATEPFWALRDVTCDINQGDVVGLIGRNGAGKSTLLKVLSRITRPTSGRAVMRGRLASLLEVGTGFHPELSGRENIYLAGVVLGMSRAEVKRKFDEITAFAEVDQFLDTPVKRYSSGMYVRLAFAVAAHLETEILLVDEVLAVGDASFQRKCLGKMRDVSHDGRTILFVSHNMGAITRLCNRGIWLHDGRVRDDGDIESIVASYLAAGADDSGEVSFPDDETAPGSEYVRLRALRVRNADGHSTPTIDVRRPFAVEAAYRVLKPVTTLRIGLRLMAHDGTIVISSTDADDCDGERFRDVGEYVSRCEFPGDLLNYGHYSVSIGADFPMIRTHFSVNDAITFRVEPTGGAGGHISDGRSGILRMRLPWEVLSS